MTILQYAQMNEGAKLKALDQSGVLIAERKSSYCDIKLYQIDGFYVELYHHTHFNVLVNINSFTNLDLLDPYFENMNVDALFCAN